MKKILNLKMNFTTTSTAILFVILGGYLLNYFLNILLANYMGASIFGDYSLAMKVLLFIATIALFGSNRAVLRFLTNFFLTGDHESSIQFIKWNIRTLFNSFIICLLTAFITFFMAFIFHLWQIKDLMSYHLSCYMLWLAPIMAIYMLLPNFLMCNKNVVLATFIYKILREAISIGVFVSAIFLLDLSIKKLHVIFTAIAIIFFSLILIEYLILKRCRACVKVWQLNEYI
jgi:O-antigen/teichoic acid export membrane protein